MSNDDRNKHPVPSKAPPPGFVRRAGRDETIVLRKEYGDSRQLAEILTGEPQPVETAGAPLTGGRGTASVYSIAGIGDVVLRRYRRGGLVGKVFVDRYISGSRPFRELAVLALARFRGVPVPEVIGASSIRAGLLHYRGRIATRLIAGSTTLPVFIEESRGDTHRLAAILKRAGAAVRTMHDAGIDHADLNMNNILIDRKGAPFIIDFDRARIYRELGSRRRFSNMRRLLRSLRKLRSAGLPVGDGDYSMIIKGYAGDNKAFGAVIEKKTLGSSLLKLRSAVGKVFR